MLKNISNTDHISAIEKNQIQPNAVDLRIAKLFRLLPTEFYLSNDRKQHRQQEEIHPDDNGEFFLEPNQSYQFDCLETVTIPTGYAGWLIARSTLNRNGVFITSGLYDSGFNNIVGGTIHVRAGPAKIVNHTRIAQFIYAEAETVGMYDGDYNAPSSVN
jgi:deoxycytidine triphosphate deaminase|tara:strand:- start:287 stop:763 length:477 start_codon:yes stop_codon:yes gene_type:complete